MNLYGFVGNGVVNLWDYLGLHCRDCRAESDACHLAARQSYDRETERINKSYADARAGIAERHEDCLIETLVTEGALQFTLQQLCNSAAGAQEAIVAKFHVGQHAGAALIWTQARKRCRKEFADCVKDYGKDKDGCPCEENEGDEE